MSPLSAQWVCSGNHFTERLESVYITPPRVYITQAIIRDSMVY